MRNLAALLCFVTLVLGADGGDRLLAARSAGLLSTGGTLPPPPPEPTPQVISVGEEVTGTLDAPVFEMLFELTAPSDGTLVVDLSSGAHLSSNALLVLEDVYWWPMWRSPRVFSTVATLQVTAGQTYRLSVWTPSWDLYEPLPFVLTTSLESGPVTLPPVCEFAPPGSTWVCVNGGWVPPDHPLALPDPPIPPSPPVPPPPSGPPVVGPTGCSTVKPAETWICVSGAWLPPDHPLALGAPTNPPPPSTPPVPPLPQMPPTQCPGSDPFAGIPGLVGVCVNGGWIPIGHPLGPPPPPPPRLVRGDYTLTISSSDASGACAGVPAAARRRVYLADVQQTGSDLRVSLTGAQFASNTFSGVITPTGDVTFTIRPASPWDYDPFDVVERLSDGSLLIVSGVITARSTAAGISGSGGEIHTASGWCQIDSFEMVPSGGPWDY